MSIIDQEQNEVKIHTAKPLGDDTERKYQTPESKPMLFQKKDSTSNIDPLGLFAFGFSTLLLNLHNVGLFNMSPAILGMGLVFGGLTQFISGYEEWKKGKNFTSVAFTSYGAFWISFVLIHAIPVWEWCDPADNKSLAWYLFCWCLFTLIMFVASFSGTIAVRIVFGTLSLLFLLLAIANWANSNVVNKVAGYVGIICALSAVYTGAADVWEDAFGKSILPVGKPKTE